MVTLAADVLSTVDASAPLVVLRLSLGKFQHGVLGIARSLGRLGVPVYAARADRREPALRSRFLAGSFELARRESEPVWLEQTLALAGGLTGAQRPLLLPIDDRAAVFAADHHEALAQRFRLPAQPAGLTRALCSKRELAELCARFQIPAPATAAPAEEAELLELAREQGYPVVLKQSDPWLPSRDPGAPSVHVARSEAELVAAYRRMESDVAPQTILQEFIPGDADSVWMFDGYFDAGSRCLAAFTGRKLRQYRPRVGPTSLGICEPNPDVVELACALMAATGYSGIVDMGFRYDARDGRYKLLDVNPRIGATFRLFVAGNGLDVVRAQYLDLTGQEVPAGGVVDGRKWIVEPTDLASAALLRREGELGVRQWLTSLRGVEEAAWWARDDPRPFLAMCARLMPHTYAESRRRNGSGRA
jgi:predicted ATP-grasp superfamily ATP-dependent carboligase